MDNIHRWVPYCGAAPSPHEWLGRWNTDPVLLVAMCMAAVALWHPWVRSAALGQAYAGAASRRRALRWAWVAAALLYVSPLCALSSAFFAVRVLHHIALVLLLAPLLVQGWMPALYRWRAPLWPMTALSAASFWFWHAPAPYAAALSSDAVYGLMQLSLLVAAMGFWLAVRQAAPAAAVASIGVTTIQMGLLGALITFAAQPLYEPHLASALAWGVSPLEDQQRAGILMWAPGSFAYLAAALWIGWRWLRDERPALAMAEAP